MIRGCVLNDLQYIYKHHHHVYQRACCLFCKLNIAVILEESNVLVTVAISGFNEWIVVENSSVLFTRDLVLLKNTFGNPWKLCRVVFMLEVLLWIFNKLCRLAGFTVVVEVVVPNSKLGFVYIILWLLLRDDFYHRDNLF